MKDKSKRGRQSLISIADALKLGRKMSNDEGGLRSLYLPELEITISSVSAAQLGGGDFHGIVHRQQGRTAVIIGDISGHDLSCTIVATRVIEFIEEYEEEMLHPNLFLRKMSIELYAEMQSYGRFFTAALCMVDVENNQILYASAGHPQSMLYRAETGSITRVGAKSMPVGFEKEVSYNLVQHPFHTGDILLMFTDGISSARSAVKEEFGEVNIAKIMIENAKTRQGIVPALTNSVRAFTSGALGGDDETCVCIARV